MTAHSSAPTSERLLQLSDDVRRIAGTLARLSGDREVVQSGVRTMDNAPGDISAEAVMNVIRGRRLRAQFFREDLFADPAWDMLLDLFQAELNQQRVPVSSLCLAAAVPATTALRWLNTLVQEGLCTRRADPHDGRRVFVELSPDASSAMRTFFAQLDNLATI